MFSVNVEKLLKMTDSEHDGYLSSANKVLGMMDSENTVLGIVGDAIMAFKMAGTIHELGKSVLFIDCDMSDELFLSKYRLGKDLKGVTSYLSGSEDARDLVCVTNRSDFDVVFTVQTGLINVKDVESSRLRDFADNYLDYDYVVVYSDETGKAAAGCDRAVLMLQQSDYSEMSAEQKVKNLDKQGCYVLGVIINQ